MIYIKRWFMNNLENEVKRENGGFLEDIGEIVKESEKAVCVRVYVGYHSSLPCKKILKWIPKSCLISKEEAEAEEEAEEERIQNYIKKTEEGLNNYTKLLEWAKSQGLKVGNRPKKENLINKIKKAGLCPPVDLI